MVAALFKPLMVPQPTGRILAAPVVSRIHGGAINGESKFQSTPRSVQGTPGAELFFVLLREPRGGDPPSSAAS